MQVSDGGYMDSCTPLSCSHSTLGSCQAPGSLSKIQETWWKLQPKLQVLWAEDSQMNSLTSLSPTQTSSMSSKRTPSRSQKAGTLILKGTTLLLSDPASVTQLLWALHVQPWNRHTATFSAFRVTARTKQRLGSLEDLEPELGLLVSRSVMSDSQRPHGLQPTRLLHPWDVPGKSTGVGCHCLLWEPEYLVQIPLPPVLS